MQNESQFLTVDEAAQLASLSHWTIRLWLQKGRLVRYKSGSRTVVSRPEAELATRRLPRMKPASLGPRIGTPEIEDVEPEGYPVHL
jgi:excisionase family DNA binding protein